LEKRSKKPQPKKDETPRCVIYAAPATRLADGEPSCENNFVLVYEHQLEDHAKTHAAVSEPLQVDERWTSIR
jgi:hypothetical protein